MIASDFYRWSKHFNFLHHALSGLMLMLLRDLFNSPEIASVTLYAYGLWLLPQLLRPLVIYLSARKTNLIWRTQSLQIAQLLWMMMLGLLIMFRIYHVQSLFGMFCIHLGMTLSAYWEQSIVKPLLIHMPEQTARTQALHHYPMLSSLGYLLSPWLSSGLGLIPNLLLMLAWAGLSFYQRHSCLPKMLPQAQKSLGSQPFWDCLGGMSLSYLAYQFATFYGQQLSNLHPLPGLDPAQTTSLLLAFQVLIYALQPFKRRPASLLGHTALMLIWGMLGMLSPIEPPPVLQLLLRAWLLFWLVPFDLCFYGSMSEGSHTLENSHFRINLSYWLASSGYGKIVPWLLLKQYTQPSLYIGMLCFVLWLLPILWLLKKMSLKDPPSETALTFNKGTLKTNIIS